jgi:lipid A disaccharide synthetase
MATSTTYQTLHTRGRLWAEHSYLDQVLERNNVLAEERDKLLRERDVAVFRLGDRDKEIERLMSILGTPSEKPKAP